MIAPLYPATSGAIEAAAMRTRGLAAGLRRRGHSVSVVVGMAPGKEPDRSGDVNVVTAPWPDLRRFAKAPGMSRGRLVNPGEPLHMPLPRAMLSAVFPERYALWVPGAVAKARALLKKDTLIISTSARSAHIAARLVHGSRPWIADLNDPWAFSPKMTRRKYRDQVEWFMERSTVGHATRLSATTETMAAELQRRHGTPAAAILSGFDPHEYEHLRPAPRGLPRRVVFAGTFYWTIDFRPLYRAIREGIDEGWLTPETLQVSVVGHLASRAGQEAQDHGVADIVEARELIARDELLDRLAGADALILPFYDQYTLAMKFFEYVGAGRPIIGYGPPDRVAAKLIDQHHLGVIVNDKDGFKQRLHELVDDGDALPAPTGEDRLAFTWDRSIDRLEALIADAVAAAGSA